MIMRTHPFLRMATLLLVLAVALTPVAVAANAAEYKYLPNAKSNTWNYERGQAESTTSVSYYNGGWAYFRNFLGKDRWLWVAKSGNVYEWNASQQKYYIAFKLGSAVGTQFALRLEDHLSDGAIATVESRTDVISTKAGVFDSCVRISVQSVGAVVELSEMIFAPGVGLVSFTQSTDIPWDVTSQLKTAKIGGVSYPRPDAPITGWGVALKMPERVVKNISTDFAPTLIIFNSTNGPVRFESPTSQMFDFVVRDSSGVVIWRWASTMFFTQQKSQMMLSANSLMSFKSGTILPSFLSKGNYTLEAYLTAVPEMKASITFEVK